MDFDDRPRKIPWTLLVGVFSSLLGGLFLALMYRFRRERSARLKFTVNFADLNEYRGLSEEEAESRRSIDYESIRAEQNRIVKSQIWRNNVISIFNLSLLGLAIVQLLLADPLGALITFGTLILNITVNVIQEMMSIRRVAELRERARPLATAIRSGRLKGIRTEAIVQGDVLLVERGDEFPADGQMIAGGPPIMDDPAQRGIGTRAGTFSPGDRIRAGSVCPISWMLYQTSAPPPAQISLESDHNPLVSRADLTPLQRLIGRLLRWMLGVVVVFMMMLGVFIFTRVTEFPLTLDNLMDISSQYLDLSLDAVPQASDLMDMFFVWTRNAAGLIFSLAPSGLFFMIVVSYAVGVADIGKFGALVRRAQTVETLAQVTSLCISKGASLTGAEVQMEMAAWDGALPALPSSHVAKILGIFGRSLPAPDFLLRALADNFEGEARQPQADFYYLNAYGWGAVSYDDVDLRGTFVLGHPDLLKANLASKDDAATTGIETVEEHRKGIGRVSISLHRLFNRRPKEEQIGSGAPEGSGKALDAKVDDGVNSDLKSEKQAGRRGLRSSLQRGLARLGGNFSRKDERATDSEPGEPQHVEAQVELMFAYIPEPQPLFDQRGSPMLPEKLIPLCRLVFIEQMRPEALQVVQSFSEAGVQVKILASDGAERVRRMAIQLGLDSTRLTRIVSGPELVAMSDQAVEVEIERTDLFCELDSLQKERLVSALRQRGEYVAMVGERADDERALRQAHVRIASLQSHRPALRIADILLLKDSIEALTLVFQKGQRIVNGLMSVLNLNLVQIGYVSLLLLAFFFFSPRLFYYHPTQGGMVVLFSVVLPGIGLTLWAPKGAAPRRQLGRRLARFVLPAAATMTAAVLVVHRAILGAGAGALTARLGVTHTLVGMGLLLVLFAQPPSKFWTGGNRLSGDRRIAWMVFALFGAWMVLISIPLANRFLFVSWMNPVWWHAVIVLSVALWALALRTIWRSQWLDRFFGVTVVGRNPAAERKPGAAEYRAELSAH